MNKNLARWMLALALAGPSRRSGRADECAGAERPAAGGCVVPGKMTGQRALRNPGHHPAVARRLAAGAGPVRKTGWLHQSALTKKTISMKAGGQDVATAASGDELALAGKGFNSDD
jgi:hypothetical protein